MESFGKQDFGWRGADHADVAEYEVQSADETVAGAQDAADMQALRYCVVTSSLAPSESEMKPITEAASRIKREYPHLELCAA